MGFVKTMETMKKETVKRDQQRTYVAIVGSSRLVDGNKRGYDSNLFIYYLDAVSTLCSTWTHSWTMWICELVRSQRFKTASVCDRCLSQMPVTEEYIPVPVQCHRYQECREQITPVVFDR